MTPTNQNEDGLLLSIQIFARDGGPEIVAGMRFSNMELAQVGQVLGMANGYIKRGMLNIYKSINTALERACFVHAFFEESIAPGDGETKFYFRNIPDDEPDPTPKSGDPAGK